MGKIRKLTLEEWFLDYQLDAIWTEYCHLGFNLDIDVTNLVEAAAERGVHFSPTAAMIRAIGLLALEKPAANRVMLQLEEIYQSEEIFQFKVQQHRLIQQLLLREIPQLFLGLKVM